MKKLSALLLSLLLLLTACGTPATPGDAVTLPTPNDEILVEEGLHAEDLPEVCRLWFDLAETSGAADKNSKLPLASRADEGACNYLAVRLPGGTYTDLIQEGKLADEGVTLADFSGGRAKQEGSYGQLAWNGELYHAFTVSAADCTLPNLTAPDGGILRLNISGDCTVDGGGTEYACFEGFDCVLVTGDGTLTVSNAAALDCGGGDLPIPSLVLDGDVTLRCGDIRLAAPNTVDVPALAVLGGTLCTDMLWLSNGMLVNAGGTLSVQGSVQELKRAVFRGGTTLLGAAEQKAEFILSGGTAHLADGLAEGSTVEGGAGVRCGALHMGSNVEEKGTLLVESGSLTVGGEFWLQNAALTVTGGELTLAGDASIDRGEVHISGGTVSFEHGLWLGEGDIVITGGTVIVPGGEAGLTAENGKVTISGGAVREP